MEDYDCSTLCDRIKKRTDRKPSIVVKREIVDTLPNYPAQIPNIQFIKKEKQSTAVNALTMSETIVSAAPTSSVQPIKKRSGRKMSVAVKKEILETIPNNPAPIQSVQLIGREKPSTFANVVEMSEAIASGTAPTQIVQPKKKSGRKPSVVIKKEILETIPNDPAPMQNVQLIGREKPSTFANVEEMSEAIASGTAPTQIVQPKKKSGRKPSVVIKKEILETIPNDPAPMQNVQLIGREKPSTFVNVEEMSEAIASGTAPTQIVQPKKKSGRKPSVVIKKEILETIPNDPAPMQSVQLIEREKPSTFANVVEMSEAIASGTAPTQIVQPKKKSGRKPSVVIKKEILETIPNDPAPMQSVQLIGREKPSTFANVVEMSEAIASGTAPTQIVQPKKKSGRKPSVVIKKEILETIPNDPSPMQSVQLIGREKPSTFANVVEISEAIASGTAPTQIVQPKKKSGRKPSVVIKKEILETIPNDPAPMQSVQLIGREKPSTFANVVEKSEAIASGTAPTQIVRPNKKKSGRKSSVAVKKEILETIPGNPAPMQSVPLIEKEKTSTFANAVERSEAIASSTAPTQIALPINKRSGRQPSTVAKEIVYTKPDNPTTIQSVQLIRNNKPPVVNAREVSETIASGIAPRSAQSFRARSDGIRSSVASAMGNTEANGTAPTQSNRRIIQRSGRKPKFIKQKKNHRNVVNTNCFKSPLSVYVPVTSGILCYKGTFFTVGDIVSVLGTDDCIYYAQIRGLLLSQYCEKSAFITWLYPTTASRKGRFEPHTYVIGSDDELIRDLDYFEFIMHAPNEYYKSKPLYPIIPQKPVYGLVKFPDDSYITVKLPYKGF